MNINYYFTIPTSKKLLHRIQSRPMYLFAACYIAIFEHANYTANYDFEVHLIFTKIRAVKLRAHPKKETSVSKVWWFYCSRDKRDQPCHFQYD